MANTLTRPYIQDGKYQGDRLGVDSGNLTIKKRIDFSIFSAAATTVNLDTQPGQTWLTAWPAGTIIEAVYAYLVTAFSGGAVSAATISVGTTASAAAYMAATNVFTGAAIAGKVGLTLVPGTFVNATTPLALGTIRVQLITTTANANALTAGKLDLFFQIRAASIKST
jgi:multidrug efflux pump subunit AcrA (membrane-fusion protein)